jgi:hypothetical protein
MLSLSSGSNLKLIFFRHNYLGLRYKPGSILPIVSVLRKVRVLICFLWITSLQYMSWLHMTCNTPYDEKRLVDCWHTAKQNTPKAMQKGMATATMLVPWMISRHRNTCLRRSVTLHSGPVCQDQRRGKVMDHGRSKQAQRCLAYNLGCH